MPGLGPFSSGISFWLAPESVSVVQADLACAILGQGDISLATASVALAVSASILGQGDVSLATASLTQPAAASIFGAGDISLATASSAQAAACSISGFALVGASSVLTYPAASAIVGSGLVNVQMLGGITQPGGNGGDILYQDDAHADASLDSVAGSYHYEDLYQKSQAKGWKALDGVTGAVEKWGGAVFGLLPEYWFHVSIQNGDGVGTATTTLRVSRCNVKFDATKTQKVSSVGIANRWTIMGFLQESVPGEPLGYDGVDAVFGTTTTIDGNHQLYGSKLHVLGSSSFGLNIRRASSSAVGEMVHLTLENYSTGVGSTIQVGSSAIPTGRARHVVANVWGNAAASVSLFNCNDADDVVLGGATNTRLSVANAYSLIRGLRISGTPVTADLRGSSVGEDLIDVTWSGKAAQVATGLATSDWRTYLPTVVDAAGAPQAGELIQVYDKDLALVASGTSDANGIVSYNTVFTNGQGNTITIANALKVRVGGATGWTERGPFTVKRNGLTVRKFTWPRTSYVISAVTYYQLLPLNEIIGPAESLKAHFGVNPGGGPPPLTVQFEDLSTTRPGDAITAWAWEFGDGHTSTQQNPIHVYTVEGFYAVRLTVTDSSGTASITLIGAVFVQALSSPFQRQFVPETPFVPLSVATVPFVAQSPPVTPFVRLTVPGSAYTPCERAAVAVVIEEGVFIAGAGVIPVGEPVQVALPAAPTAFAHRAVPATSFNRRPVPAVVYSECGSPKVTPVPVEDIFIAGGGVIPVLQP